MRFDYTHLLGRNVRHVMIKEFRRQQTLQRKKRSEKQGRKGKVYPLNAEFQRRSRKDKKAFFNEQHIKLEENNRRAKTRELFREIGDIKGTFHSKINTIKDRNCRDLVDA